MHQRGGLQRVVRPLVGHLRRGESLEVFVYQRQQLLGRGSIAAIDLIQDAGDVGHVP